MSLSLYIYIYRERESLQDTVGFHNFNLRIFNLRVSNPNKLIVDVFLTRCRISMCQGLGPKNTITSTPSPPTKSLGFGGFDSSRLLILRGGNSHVRIIS